MVGENFEVCFSEMVRNALKLSTMVGENLKFKTLFTLLVMSDTAGNTRHF